QFFGGPDNVIYAIAPNGDLYWYKYVAGNGTAGAGAWVNNAAGAKIGSGQHPYVTHFASAGGVIYSIRQGASLWWSRYLAGNGTNGPGAWANNGTPIRIGDGWDDEFFTETFSIDGAVYGVHIDDADPPGPDGNLIWYSLGNWQNVDVGGKPIWLNSTGNRVGSGFTVTRTANLQGYTDAWAYFPGNTLVYAG